MMKFNYIPKQDRQLNTNPNISLAQTREADKLEADLGYLYENVVAQMLTANEKDLYYHTWRKKNSTHSYEIDFLIETRQ